MPFEAPPTRPCAAWATDAALGRGEAGGRDDHPLTLGPAELRLLYEGGEDHMPEIVHALAALTTPQRRAVRDLIEAFVSPSPARQPCRRA